MNFFSDKSVILHKKYLENLNLRCSALLKSSPEVIGMSLDKMRKKRFLNKPDIIALRSEIICHEIFFSSFGKSYEASCAVKKKYRTEQSFLYELYRLGLERRGEFLGIFVNRGEVSVKISDCERLLTYGKPILAVDLCEHAYFMDYGFSKGEYLRNILSYLNLGKLDENSQ